MNAEMRSFEHYVLAIADRLVDRYDLHPDDVTELLDWQKRNVIAWQSQGVSVAQASKLLFQRFQLAIAAPLENPGAGWVLALLGFTAAVGVFAIVVRKGLSDGIHRSVAKALSPTPASS